MKTAQLIFTETGSDGLMHVLENLLGFTFEYKDKDLQDKEHYVRLEGVGSRGQVTFIDLEEKDAKPYTIDLYDTGPLTYV